MTALDVLVDDLRCEQMDRTYRHTPDTADPLSQLIGILAALLGEDAHRSRVEAGRKQRVRAANASPIELRMLANTREGHR